MWSGTKRFEGLPLLSHQGQLGRGLPRGHKQLTHQEEGLLHYSTLQEGPHTSSLQALKRHVKLVSDSTTQAICA